MTSNSSLYLYYLRVRIARNAFTAESQSQRQFGRGVERLRAEIQRKETHQHADRRELQAPEDEGGDRSDDGNGRNRKDRAEGEIDIPGDDVVLGADQSVLRCVCVWVSEEAWSEGQNVICLWNEDRCKYVVYSSDVSELKDYLVMDFALFVLTNRRLFINDQSSGSPSE